MDYISIILHFNYIVLSSSQTKVYVVHFVLYQCSLRIAMYHDVLWCIYASLFVMRQVMREYLLMVSSLLQSLCARDLSRLRSA